MEEALFAWTDDYNVGVQEVDEQHKELVRLLNSLHTAILQHHGSETSRKILNDLAEYTRIHFTVEESLMRVSNYPGFENHKKIHEALIHQVRELQAKVDAGTAKISFELMHFLKSWLMVHILEEDKRFGAYFREAQLSPTWSGEVQELMENRKWWWKFW